MSSSPEPRPIPRTPGILAFTIALREVREQKRVGVRELARKLGVSPARVSGFEADRLPTDYMIGRITGVLQVRQPVHERLIAMAQEAPEPTFVENRVDGRKPLTLTYEQSAIAITEWAPRLIPEIVRAPSYVRALLAPRISDPEVLDRQMFAHLTRANVLTPGACKPDRYTLLLSEAALRPPTVSATDMLEQLYTLDAVTEQSKLDLRLVRESDCPPDLFGARVVYTVDALRAVAVLPHLDTTIYLSKASDVAHHQAVLSEIAEKALDKQESRRALAVAIEELEATLPATSRADEAALPSIGFAPLEGSSPWHLPTHHPSVQEKSR